MTRENTTVRIPCGMLYSQGREYFLLHPFPIRRDDWERDNCYRFLVVPSRFFKRTEDDVAIYPPARHVVTSAYLLDYMSDMPEIHIQKALHDIFEEEAIEKELEPDLSRINFEDLVPVLNQPVTVTNPAQELPISEVGRVTKDTKIL